MSLDAVVPAELASHLAQLRAALPHATDTHDRRGFQLLTWPGIAGASKPNECSLEHEAHLSPMDASGAGSLLAGLFFSEGRSAGPALLPAGHPAADWVVRQYERPPGTQSVDSYFDFPSEALGASGHTLRMRTKYAPHMTCLDLAVSRKTLD
jgi:hypothetical protein